MDFQCQLNPGTNRFGYHWFHWVLATFDFQLIFGVTQPEVNGGVPHITVHVMFLYTAYIFKIYYGFIGLFRSSQVWMHLGCRLPDVLEEPSETVQLQPDSPLQSMPSSPLHPVDAGAAVGPLPESVLSTPSKEFATPRTPRKQKRDIPFVSLSSLLWHQNFAVFINGRVGQCLRYGIFGKHKQPQLNAN